MNTETIAYASKDGKSTIRALLWTPNGLDGNGEHNAEMPRGVVQLVHGMSEHVERYAGFAEALCDAGFVVCANDHIGHGKSASSEDELGHMPLEGGEDVLIEDVYTLRQTVQARLADEYSGSKIPYVIFGHSMGSFVTRVYLTRHGEGVAAAVICGTGQQSKVMAKGGGLVTRFIAKFKGETYRSAFADSLGAGGYGKQIENAQTDLDWLATDPEVVAEYQRDPLCGQVFTVGAYTTLANLVSDAIDTNLAKQIPASLPMFFIAGAGDPVGEFGKGVQRAAQEYKDAGIKDVQIKIYEGARHEILNEPIKGDVYKDTLAFLENHSI